jgi:malate synthase
MDTTSTRLELRAPQHARAEELLPSTARAFLVELHDAFGAERAALLARRTQRRARLLAGERLDFLRETRALRERDWTIAPVPPVLADRRVEITGPTDRKMVIGALSCGARAFMADFEDALAPTWGNVLDGQANLRDAVAGTIAMVDADGRERRLGKQVATLLVRPRGWHLEECHVRIDDASIAASLFDAGLFLFHNAERQLAAGAGPFLYLPKLESHREARLWNDVFVFAQERLGIPQGSIKATVLIETIFAAFEMDEILWELRDHVAGLNAGRWDYIFSVIKAFRERPEAVLPDRAAVTMTVPFMRAYSELLVRTCHRRGAHAMGGMAAFIPNRREPEVTERALAAVRADKEREARAGFDGTWVAHPDLVPVATEVFDAALGARPNQLERRREDVRIGAAELIDVRVPDATITAAGLRANVRVAIEYLAAWLGGRGAVAIADLMEDAATAEIARAQVWQWIRHGRTLPDGRAIDAALVRELAQRERAALAAARPDLAAEVADAARLFEQVTLAPELVEFLTLPAYELLCAARG